MDISEKINLQLDDDFFKEEVRCEFLVTETTKKIWAIELDLLNELIRVCEKHKIKMCVWAGTLLGTIRHKGMIPWDDDIDVCLSREEYEKLCKIAPYEFKHPYFFQNYKTDPQYLIGYSRLRNSLSTGYVVGEDSSNYNNGIYIDIFVLDGLTDNESLLRKQLRKQNKLMLLYNLYNKNVYSRNRINSYLKHGLSILMHATLFIFIDRQKILNAYDNNLKKYNQTATRLSMVTHPLDFAKKYWIAAKDMENLIFMPFESIMVPVPSNYKEILTHIYGNFMEFPPIEKRGVWHEGVIKFDPDIPYKENIHAKFL